MKTFNQKKGAKMHGNNLEMRPQGRPPLSDGWTETIAFKVPYEIQKKVDEAAQSRNMTRSQYMRALIEKALKSDGLI